MGAGEAKEPPFQLASVKARPQRPALTGAARVGDRNVRAVAEERAPQAPAAW